MRAIHKLALATLSFVPFASNAVVAGEVTYLTPPLFREQARDTQNVRSFTDLRTTPQPVSSANSVSETLTAQVDKDVVATGSF